MRNTETGKFIRVAGIRSAASFLVAENCLCVRRKSARAQLAHVPPVFNSPKLSRLKARLDLHPAQADGGLAKPGASGLCDLDPEAARLPEQDWSIIGVHTCSNH
jgi:hypothetical protein